jgi:pyruvate,water dikinase
MAFIDWLHKGRLARGAAGGKGAALSDLMAAGYTVPAGFCVNAEGYRYFLSEAGLDTRFRELTSRIDPSSSASNKEVAEAASSLIDATPLLDELRDEIAAAYDELTAMTGLACAVRSSALAEDGAGASFAGLYESYLNVRGIGAVLEAVHRCYASLWSERAVRYRAGRGGDAREEAMAVVVMGLVPSETSGIAFTAHPVSGAQDVVVINAAFGLGEPIVSGAVTPDSFVVGKGDFTIRERDIAEKELAVYAHPDGAGTIERPLDTAKASAASLTDEQALEVARIATRIEAHCGSPQDVEWGIAGGQLYLLQTRPITTL